MRLSQWPDARTAWSAGAAISGDGRVAVFHSRKNESDVPSPMSVFRIDLDTLETVEDLGDNPGLRSARTECAADHNLVTDIFAWERATVLATRVNVVTPALPWLGASKASAVRFHGLVSAFFSCQPVTDEDDRGTFDLFIAGS